METQELHRGRLIDHIQLVVKDLAASKKFYEAVLKPLGREFGGDGPGFAWADEFVISAKDSPASEGHLTGRVHLAFQAKDRAQVDAFYKAAIEAGAKDHGPPGERKNYHPGYYAAFVIDPDGNNVEAVFHGPAKRSAESVKITF